MIDMQGKWRPGVHESVGLVVACVVGWLGIVLADELAFLSIGGYKKAGGALIALIIVTLLWFYYFNIRRNIDVDRAGDSLYYLGLLLTLGSLIWALVGPADEDDRISKIVGNFGIALTSTVAGILGRILFQNLSRIDQSQNVTPSEDQDAPGAQNYPIPLDAEMGLMVQHIRQHMREAVDAFSGFNREVMQNAAAMRSAMLRHSEEVTQRVEHLTTESTEDITEAHHDIVSQHQQTRETLEALGVESIKILRETQAEMFKRLEETSEHIEQPIETIVQSSRAMANQINEIMANLERVSTQTANERMGLEGVGEIIRKEAEHSVQMLNQLSESAMRTNSAVDGLRESVVEVGSALSTMIDENRRKSEEFRNEMEVQEVRMVQRTEQNRMDIDRQIRTWSSNSARIADAFNVISDGAEALEKTLTLLRETQELLATLGETVSSTQVQIGSLGNVAEETTDRMQQSEPPLWVPSSVRRR